MTTNGIFITIEGPEGAGKTTTLNRLVAQLQLEGVKVVQTREPGGIAIAEQIRSVILDKGNTLMDARTEALLYAAARRQHLVEKVRPAVEAGYVVLCDRFIDSSLAYQGHARGLGIEEVYSINQFAVENTMPQMTLYFDLEPKIGLERIHKNMDREVNRLDLEDIRFHETVREGYQFLLKKFPERIKIINADQSEDLVFEEAYHQVKNLLQNN